MIDLSTYAQRVHLKNLVVTSKSFNVDRLFVNINKINFDTVYLNISLFSLDHCIKFFKCRENKMRYNFDYLTVAIGTIQEGLFRNQY